MSETETTPVDVESAIRNRYSARAFLDRPVDTETIREVLDIARWSPSGVNAQPWNVVVATGETRRRLGEALTAHVRSGGPESSQYSYYPEEWTEPYLGRRRACGFQLYGALGIERSDYEARSEAMLRNFDFFGAPAALLVYMTDHIGGGGMADIGMFLQSVMLAAVGKGLATCPQAAIAFYPDVVATVLEPPADHSLICAISMGWPDPDAPVNNFRTERVEVDEFTTWYD